VCLRVCARVHGLTPTHSTTPAHLTDEIIEGQTILQHKLKHTLPPLPFALYIPFSNLWLLYVKYIYVCIYTVYMYW